jgi:hypothetical protein
LTRIESRLKSPFDQPDDPITGSGPPSDGRLPVEAACRHCGARLPAGVKFCIECGSPTRLDRAPTQPLRCRRCGAAWPSGLRFCVNCGEPLAAARPSTGAETLAAPEPYAGAVPVTYRPAFGADTGRPFEPSSAPSPSALFNVALFGGLSLFVLLLVVGGVLAGEALSQRLHATGSSQAKASSGSGILPTAVSAVPTMIPSLSAAPGSVAGASQPAATPSPQTASSPAAGLAKGDWAMLSGLGDFDCVRIHSGVGQSTPTINCLPNGARVRLLDGPQYADGLQWWQVGPDAWMPGISVVRATGPASPSGLSSTDVVKTYYTLMGQGKFPQAYQLLSPAYQARDPYPHWLTEFSTMRQLFIEAIGAGSSPSAVKITFQTIDEDPSGRVSRRFSGQVFLTQSNGEWRIDRTYLSNVSDQSPLASVAPTPGLPAGSHAPAAQPAPGRAAPNAQCQPSGSVYTVKAGDTLEGIAAQFGVSAVALAAANNLNAQAPLVVGQTLRIPAQSSSSSC